MMPARRMPRMTPLTAGLPMNAATSGPPSAAASAATSTRNSAMRTMKRRGPLMPRRRAGASTGSRSAMPLRCARLPAEPAHPGGRLHHANERGGIAGMLRAAAERKAGADHRLAELAAGRNPEPPIVQIGADAFLGPEHLVAGRLVNDAGNHLAIPLQP